MGWWKWKESEEEKASQVIASIFSPDYSTLKAARSEAENTATETACRPTAEASEDSAHVAGRASMFATSVKDWFYAKQRQKKELEAFLNGLPPCPVEGYRVTKEGVEDTQSGGRPHALAPNELRELIVQFAGIEGTAKYAVDDQFASQIGGRGRRGVELLVNPLLFLGGLYLATYKTVTLYQCAIPRQSVLLTRILHLMQARTPSAEKERVARRHRRLMQATSPRVLFSFLSGCFLLGVAIFTRPPPDVVDNSPEVDIAKSVMAYQKLSEDGLKWFMQVYYHHPKYAAYAAEKKLYTIKVNPQA
ncbi:hypothetical protein, conserved [Angomonas deanei]|uniref:Transmembrane protein n=1 Tax=Angomonas deanei TaxID=59799 RepID=A0A7G2CIZ1_9TRYP|nr:hypothetical protein, conserved [Angomonas deanei]